MAGVGLVLAGAGTVWTFLKSFVAGSTGRTTGRTRATGAVAGHRGPLRATRIFGPTKGPNEGKPEANENSYLKVSSESTRLICPIRRYAYYFTCSSLQNEGKREDSSPVGSSTTHEGDARERTTRVHLRNQFTAESPQRRRVRLLSGRDYYENQ
ncbi:sorting nexin-25-like protein [Corchorus olitorius]|uniref:Sorting nexin-25-like protein n=1 Tax=Corchorus olitorius TaxID=93759 RepID=A0A1R3K4X9_9ROSI|nr:sorting nexin-25-like protein [Corchorus olitorius]